MRRILGVPAADCGTIRYSAEVSIEALAAIVTHPPSEAGSSDAYAPIARTSWDASAELHVGVLGPAAWSPLQPAVPASDHITSTAIRRFIILASALAFFELRLRCSSAAVRCGACRTTRR